MKNQNVEKDERAKNQAKAQLESIIEMVDALESENDEEREKAEQRIQEDPLSVEVRSDWHTVGSVGEVDEFMIVLCTGGPAVRIIGELDKGEPYSAKIEYQDWFTSWTEFYIDNEDDREKLLTYCRQFYFSE